MLRRSRSPQAQIPITAQAVWDAGLSPLPLSSQRTDGSWDEPEITGTGFPGVFYLKYDMYRQNFPLLALATYVNYRNGFITKPGFYQAKA